LKACVCRRRVLGWSFKEEAGAENRIPGYFDRSDMEFFLVG
jgi:hypothetical protein